MQKILVVDDNRETTDLIKIILNSSGYECTTASNGKEGLDKIYKNKFDLILMDLAMPEMSGLDALAKLKEANKLADNKILVFTASPTLSDTEVDKLKKEYRVLGRLRKPFKKNDLLDTIAKHLES